MPMLAIRLDDITPAMNWDNFMKVKEILDEYDIRPLIGIVPDNQDPKLNVGTARADFWEFMRKLQAEDWSIAQHGYQHLYTTEDSGILGINRFSEFAGIAYEDQFEKLRLGQEILQNNGIYATIFMAPGHTFDDATRLALEQMKFQFVTDGYCDRPYFRDGIGYIPCTMSKPRLPKVFDTLCLHVNGMSEQDMQDLRDFIQENINYIIDFLDILSPEYFTEWGFRTRRNEKKALKRRANHQRAAESSIMQDFLQKTYSTNKVVKTLKRVLGLPVLACHLLFSKNK